jgi:ABC-2 type transport system ATP-binding protein
MNEASPAIEAVDLVKRFKDVTAVDGVSLRLEAGRALALLGPNGAGKTTLVEMLEGLQAPSAGSIRLFGQAWGDSGASTLRRSLGICLQDSRLPEKLEALEVLRMFAAFHGLDAARAQEVLNQVGLQDKAKTWTQRLSGGQRQRLALGIAMLPRPRLLLLDEPTTGLDPSARREVWALVEELKSGGCALLLTTHYMEEAEALCPEVALMHKGRLLARGPVPALLAEHTGGDRLEASFAAPVPAALGLGVPGLLHAESLDNGTRLKLRVRELGEALPAFVQAAANSGAVIVSLSTHRATLEDLFINLTGEGLAGAPGAPEAGGEAR